MRVIYSSSNIVESKCSALLYNRTQLTGAKQGTVLSDPLHIWCIDGPISNPPSAHSLPEAFIYLQQYAIDLAYVPPHQTHESRTAFEKRLYWTPLHMIQAPTRPSALRITRKYSDVDWAKVWRNLHSSALPSPMMSTC